MINTGGATPRLDLLGPILTEGFSEESYIAHRILPTLLVQKRNGAIPSFLFTNDQVLSIKHAPKTAYAAVQSSLGQATFACEEAGVEEYVSPEDYEIMGKDTAEMVIGRRLVHVVLRARDAALSSQIFSGTGESTFSANLVTAGATWDNASGDPMANVLDAKQKVYVQTGVPANCMAISYGAYIKLMKNPKIQSAVRNVLGYSGADARTAIKMEVPAEVLAATFGLDEIIIAGGVKNTAKEGQTASRSFVWPDTYALVFRKSVGQQDSRETALGRTFVYDLAASIGSLATGSIDSMRALMLESYRREDLSADAFRCREYVDMKVFLPTAASLIKSI